jgi:hypothetical protein
MDSTDEKFLPKQQQQRTEEKFHPKPQQRADRKEEDFLSVEDFYEMDDGERPEIMCHIV